MDLRVPMSPEGRALANTMNETVLPALIATGLPAKEIINSMLVAASFYALKQNETDHYTHLALLTIKNFAEFKKK